MKKRNFIFGIFFLAFAFAVIVNVNEINAVGEAVVCCEKTKAPNAAWCQEVTDESQCDTSGGLRSAPTSCESTAYCKTGTCVNTVDGLCMENTEQRVCENPVGGESLGLWFDTEVDEIPQCQLGCCLLGEQAAFTTQVRCKQLSSEFELETNYRTDIRTEAECIASASPKEKGACIIEEDFERTCRLVTREECRNLESGGGNTDFHAGFLCSAESLATNCGRSQQTTLIEGRDEVFFMDTCGNPANIYDAERVSEPEYWNEIIPKTESCNPNSANKNSQTCGNCNYLLGSIGARYERGVTPIAPIHGDFICEDLSCGNVDGETRDHGESWCVSSATRDNLNNAPGSREFRKVCYNGEVTVEPCADFRAETCIEDSIEDPRTNEEFSTAACRVNKWQDCTAQDNPQDCGNIDKRDCAWVGQRTTTVSGEETILEEGECVPANPPGFDFWNAESDAASICVQADASCTAVFVKQYVDGEGNIIVDGAESIAAIPQAVLDTVGVENIGVEFECESGCDCVGLSEDANLDKYSFDPETNPFVQRANNICTALGDCGVVLNYVGDEGYYDLGDLAKIQAPPE